MANMLFVLALTGLISACFSSQREVHPGVRFRLTNKGLQYADDIGIKVLLTRLRRENLKDISRSSRSLSYTLSNIKNNKASIISSSFTTAPGEGLTLRANGISLDFSGNLRFKKKIGWISYSDSTSFVFKAHGITFSLTVRIGVDSRGRPTISTQEQDCSSSVDSVYVKFNGGQSWLYNMFSGEIERRVKDELRKMICKKAREGINDDGAKFMATFPVVKSVSSVAQIDYSIIENPTFTSNYMDVLLKGQFKPVGNPRATVPFVPAVLPYSAEADNMVYIWLTDYLFNTASFVYHHQGALRTVIMPKDLPGKAKAFLNTKMFKSVLPQLYQKFPERPIFIKVYTTKPPVFTSSQNGTSVTVNAGAEILVTAKNWTSINALTVGLRAVLAGSMSVKYGNLTFHTKSFTTQVHLVSSAIGNIKFNIMLLQMFLNQFIKSAHFVDQLNEFGDRGFPLPLPPHITWEDTRLVTGQGFTLIKTNLKYWSGD